MKQREPTWNRSCCCQCQHASSFLMILARCCTDTVLVSLVEHLRCLRLQVSSLNMLKVSIHADVCSVWCDCVWLNCACWSLGATRNSRASFGLEVWRMCLAIPGWLWMIYNDLILHHMDAKYDPNIGWWTRTEIVWAASASSTLLRDAGSPGTCTAAAVPTRTWVLSAPGQSATPRARRPGHAAFDATGFVQLE